MRQSTAWFCYVCLVVLRFVGIVQRGYVHPDEFFQSGQELFFGTHRDVDDGMSPGADRWRANSVPWEFEPRHAVRSIVPPSFVTLVPLRLYVKTIRPWLLRLSREQQVVTPPSTLMSGSSDGFGLEEMLKIPEMDDLTGREVLLVPRAFMAILSVMFFDVPLWHLAKSRSNHAPGLPAEMLVLASSWPCLVFGVRPFTNALEAMALSVLLLVADRAFRNDSTATKVALGLICSVGVFVRFTFVCYAFPVMVIFLWLRLVRSRSKGRVVFELILIGLAFLAVSAAFVLADAQYYSQTNPSAKQQYGWDTLKYIAPLNAFLYNSKRTNLENHGIHPRITHALVNMPMLFGPLSLFGFARIAEVAYNVLVKEDKRPKSASSFTQASCKATILIGIILLSCAPHQEPRFVLPTIIPIIVLYGKRVLGKEASPLVSWIWVIFNLLLCIFFGWLHQGGVVPSLLHLPRQEDQPLGGAEDVVYYKTYMPPTFLSRPTLHGSMLTGEEVCREEDRNTGGCDIIARERPPRIFDLKGETSVSLLHAVDNILACDELPENSPESGGVIMLILPNAAMQALTDTKSENGINESALRWNEYAVKEHSGFNAHVSTEDWPLWQGSVQQFTNNLHLSVSLISCGGKRR